MITIEGLTKKFGSTTAVDGVSLEVRPGDSVALWGANGAGKTTIIRCVLGLFRYRGTIKVAGFDALRQGKSARRLIGYVPQELGFYDDLRVGDAVAFFARLKGLRVGNADAVLAGVGLEGQHRKRIRELSGGMKQRLALGIALLGDPPVLILDEVTASLDACGREEFVALLGALGGAGKAMLFASHRIDEIQALAKRVVHLDNGRIVAECTPDEFLAASSGHSVLHIYLDREASVRAQSVLRDHGYASRMNGHGLLVPVAGTRKGAPLRALAEARIQVADFDVIPAPRGAQRQEATP